MKYAHVVNLKAYKDDSQHVVVFLLVPFFTSQVRIVCAISKMDNNLYPKSSKRGRFGLIHQMWDKMVTMIVIEKDNRMVTIFEVVQIDVEGSLVSKASKKQKMEETIEERREKTIDNLVMKKYPRASIRWNASMSMNQLGVNSFTTSPLETSLLKVSRFSQ